MGGDVLMTETTMKLRSLNLPAEFEYRRAGECLYATRKDGVGRYVMIASLHAAPDPETYMREVMA
jgi:hypothetical protein